MSNSKYKLSDTMTKVLLEAETTAKKMKNQNIESYHVLFAFLTFHDGVAYSVLTEAGVKPDTMMNMIRMVYDPENGHFRPILDGVQSSRFYQTLGRVQRSAEEQFSDSWDRYFNRVKILKDNGNDISEEHSLKILFHSKDVTVSGIVMLSRDVHATNA